MSDPLRDEARNIADCGKDDCTPVEHWERVAMRAIRALSTTPAPTREALTDAIAYAIARAPVPTSADTARDVAARLAPLVIESGYLAALSTTPAPLDVSRLAAAINDAQIDPAELRLGHDLLPVSERIAREYEKP